MTVDASQDVLTAVTALCTATTGVTRAISYFPPEIDPQDFPVCIVWLAGINESRHGYGGVSGGATGGKKYVDYEVRCWVYRESFDPATEMATWYALLDALRKKWRVNQTLSGLVQRFGEDIRVECDAPINNGTVGLFSAVLSSVARQEVTG